MDTATLNHLTGRRTPDTSKGAAIKIQAGEYVYEGFAIIKTYHDIGGYYSWNIFNASGEGVDGANTFGEAKSMINRWVKA